MKMLEFNSTKELSDFIKKKSINQIDLKFTNLFGGLHHITIPTDRVNERFLKNGIGFDASSIPGFKTGEQSDMKLIPDTNFAYIDPFYKVKTLSLFASAYQADSNKEFMLDPRIIAKKAENYLITKGFANISYWSPEYEFYIFSSVNYKNEQNVSYYEVNSDEGAWNSYGNFGEGKGYLNKTGKGYHAIPPRDKLYDFRSNLVLMLEEAGIEVKYHHHEGGGAGQVEIEVPYNTLIRSGDIGQTIKYFAKMYAYQNNLTATFMPKPLNNDAGNGMHFHQKLFKDENPLFYNKNSKTYDLSETAMYYIGGILKHTPSLVAITNPSTNSYKRLVPGYEAPIGIFYSLGNRNAAVRIPKYSNSPKEKNIEFRVADGSGNIYISMAAMLMAGLDGIANKVIPEKDKFNEPSKLQLLPSSLKEALNCLEVDNNYLKKTFVEDFFKIWIEEKNKEALEISKRVHPYEIELYFDC
jgi:glutamine synthetase